MVVAAVAASEAAEPAREAGESMTDAGETSPRSPDPPFGAEAAAPAAAARAAAAAAAAAAVAGRRACREWTIGDDGGLLLASRSALLLFSLVFSTPLIRAQAFRARRGTMSSSNARASERKRERGENNSLP